MRKLACAWTIAMALLVSAPCVHATAQAGDESVDRDLRDAIDQIQQKFLQPMTHRQIVERALKALLADLDPYSNYLTPLERTLFQDDLAAGFGGLGLRLDFKHPSKQPVISHLMIESSARSAGLQRGDRIVRIDGHATRGEPEDTVIGWMRGPVGTAVRLDVVRDGSDATQAMQIVRRKVHLPSVRGVRRDAAGHAHYMLDADHRIGYIRIWSFADDTVATVEAALASLRRQRMRALVLDLRDSIGGKMQAALGTADLFIDSGRLLTVVQRDASTPHTATPGEYTGFPIAVLVNGNTVSSAEIMVGAMKDSGRALLVGQRTYGKGRVQELIELGDGRGALVLSTGTFQRPSGKTIDRHDVPEGSTDAGIAPDIELAVEGEEYDAWNAHATLLDSAVMLTEEEQQRPAPDRVLDRAIQALLANTARE